MKNKFDIEEEFHKIETLCKKYDYKAFLRFEQVHIITKCEAWYFIPRENGLIKLMHGNSLGQYQTNYHRQFYRFMSYEDLLIYISEHEESKFKERLQSYSYTKTGGVVKIS